MKKLVVRFIIFLLFSINTCVKAQNQPVKPLSDGEKILGLSQVWSEVKYNFVYFDKIQIDWDSLY